MASAARIAHPVLQAALRQIDATFDSANSRSFEMNWNRLHQSVSRELEYLYNDKSDKVSPEHKYEAGELLRFIHALYDFRGSYDIGLGVARGARCLEEFATPAHRDFLRRALGSRINDSGLDRDGTLLIAQMAAKDALKDFGIEHVVRRANSQRGVRPGSFPAALNLDHFLAITDYTHPDSGTFNVVVLAGRMAQYGHARCRQAIAPLYTPLTKGLEQLARDPHFGVSGHFYKALNLNVNKWAQEGLWTAAWKDRFQQRYDAYAFGHPLSVTGSIEKSYADRDGYDHVAKFRGFRAADVSLFNPDEFIIPEGQTVNARIAGFAKTEVLSRERGAKDVDVIEFRRGT